MADTGKPRDQRLRETVFSIAREFRLGRSERLEVACYVLDREVESYKDLSPADLSRLVDAFQGARYIATIQIERRHGHRSR